LAFIESAKPQDEIECALVIEWPARIARPWRCFTGLGEPRRVCGDGVRGWHHPLVPNAKWRRGGDRKCAEWDRRRTGGSLPGRAVQDLARLYRRAGCSAVSAQILKPRTRGASCCASLQRVCSMARIPAVRQKGSKELSTSCQVVLRLGTSARGEGVVTVSHGIKLKVGNASFPNSTAARAIPQQAAVSVWLRSRCDDQGRAKSRPPARRSHLISRD
jgi:hypothetical protein